MAKRKFKATRSQVLQGSCQARFGASPAAAGRMGSEGGKLSKSGKRWRNSSTKIKLIIISQFSGDSKLFQKVGNRIDEFSIILLTKYNKILVGSSREFFQTKENVLTLLSTISASCPTKKSHIVSESVILNAQHKGHGHVIIAQASAEGRYFFVQDANMNRFQFCADHYPVLRPLTNRQLASFTVDPAGSGLHWDDLDLDIDLDGLHADATHHETSSSNPELDNHRSTTARALGLWLEQYPDILGKLSGEVRRHVNTILSGSAGLRTSVIRELARQGSMDPHVVLDQLAELRSSTPHPSSP